LQLSHIEFQTVGALTQKVLTTEVMVAEVQSASINLKIADYEPVYNARAETPDMQKCPSTNHWSQRRSLMALADRGAQPTALASSF